MVQGLEVWSGLKRCLPNCLSYQNDIKDTFVGPWELNIVIPSPKVNFEDDFSLFPGWDMLVP